ncbi:hypothetical protein MIR68_009937 [Amoeboaphelidium protococcarum]|nr:hypothetical protein MIR68_009937 [Amoeboaphelidium protococcarum]
MIFKRVTIAIDRGGTLCDAIAQIETVQENDSKVVVTETEYKVLKLLSVNPKQYKDAPSQCIKVLLSQILEASGVGVEVKLHSIRMSTTVATNALLESKGDKFALLVTKGFKDLLRIGNQTRQDIFDLSVAQRSPQLYSQVVEVDERVTLRDSIHGHKQMYFDDVEVVNTQDGVAVVVLRPLNVETVRIQLVQLKEQGYDNIAVSLMHSYVYAHHEQQIAEIAKDLGFSHITIGSQISPMIKYLHRTSSSCVNAYLTPVLQQYLDSFEYKDACPIYFMQSNGALTPVEQFYGFKSILSGPSGGYVGYAQSAFFDTPLIGLDVGGTSSDVSRFDSSGFQTLQESNINGISLQVEQLNIQTVASGGSSRLFYRNGMLQVGPESSTAFPGPLCYRNCGFLSLTDANVVLGRIQVKYFPEIFGPNADQSLDYEASMKGFLQMQKEILEQSGRQYSVEQLALGFLDVSNETICRPIRELTQSKGLDTSKHHLCAFGGAGGQLACDVAKKLGIRTVLLHRFASILSAFGLLMSDEVYELQRPVTFNLDESGQSDSILSKIQSMKSECLTEMQRRGYQEKSVKLDVYLNMKYAGTDYLQMVLIDNLNDARAKFEDSHLQEFGFVMKETAILVDDIKIKAIGKQSLQVKSFTFHDDAEFTSPDDKAVLSRERIHLDDQWEESPVYSLDKLLPYTRVEGPALLIDRNTTVLLPHHSVALLSKEKDIRIDLLNENHATSAVAQSAECDPIRLAIFSHRFMSIAEQMGRTLEKTAVSTNIKERLDFSCALFSSDGGLCSNAPHIPIHLGSMQDCVRFQLNLLGDSVQDGDVLLSNHPSAGGTHLPDINVITPVFHDGKIVFVVASRAHHADIGGISAGSMPHNSKYLYEEGAAVKSLKLVKNGQFQMDGLKEIFLDQPAQYRNCSGARNFKDNVSDLKSQIAANNRGIKLIEELIQEYSLEVVVAYMQYIRLNASSAVRDVLRRIRQKYGDRLYAEDFLDSGTRLSLTVTISEDGDGVFDFTGSGLCEFGNLNAPIAITKSAVIYCLRSIIGQDIPLNQGCLEPITIIVPEGCILKPFDNVAVVAGNVLTSQRIVDVIFKAFRECAASQGCMNNLTFGQNNSSSSVNGAESSDTKSGSGGYGYYETIAGGSGAGPSWNGTSVHTHMTNTRITDPEILEKRYPVLLKQFSVRHGSGGFGQYKGGDGLIRELQFLQDDVNVSILSERRVFAPYGLKGGQDGSKGVNTLIKADGQSKFNLGSKNSVTVKAGDLIRIETPGGGGYGKDV